MAIKLDALYDDSLAAKLQRWRQAAGTETLFIYDPDGWRFLLLLRSSQSGAAEAITGELADLTAQLLESWIDQGKGAPGSLQFAPATTSLPQVGMDAGNAASGLSTKKPTKRDLGTFLKRRTALLEEHKTGHRPSIPKETADWVFSRSAGICEFEGCVENLFKADNGHYGYFGYLAHIVGAKDKGPRGDTKLSIDLAGSPENLMLLCDKHHRLIDRVDPDAYKGDRLVSMVRARENWRHNQLQILSYPRVHGFAFISDIAGRAVNFSHNDALKALYRDRLSPVGERVAEFALRDTNGGNDTDPIYWESYIQAFTGQIHSLNTTLRGAGSMGASAEELAVFPLGNMPSMLLGGWLVGESRKVHLFHFRRDAGTWQRSPLPRAPKFSVELPTVSSIKDARHVLLTVELTNQISEERIPSELRALPRIRVLVNAPGTEVLDTEEAITAYRQQLNGVMKQITDDFQSEEVSVLALSPAVGIFALGMKLQPRLHPKIHMYQCPRDTMPFKALIIERNRITAAGPRGGAIQLEMETK